MYQIDSETATDAEPARPAAGPLRFFSGGNPGTGTAATVVPDWFLNMIQNELAQVVTQSGVALDKADDTQLLRAIQAHASKGYDDLIATDVDLVLSEAHFNSIITVNGPAAVTITLPAFMDDGVTSIPDGTRIAVEKGTDIGTCIVAAAGGAIGGVNRDSTQPPASVDLPAELQRYEFEYFDGTPRMLRGYTEHVRATTGYWRSEQGVLLQWGLSGPVDSTAGVTFPLAFTSGAWCVVATSTSDGQRPAIAVSQISLTGCVLYSSLSTSAGAQWFAIGPLA